MGAFLIVALIVMLPVILWAYDKQVVHRACPSCRKSIPRQATVCGYCREPITPS